MLSLLPAIARAYRQPRGRGPAAAGFSLIEMLLVIAILTSVMAVVFQQIGLIQKRASTEEVRLDMMQQARETMDQMMRDLRNSGYPNSKMYGSGVIVAPVNNSTYVAAGLVKITNNPPELIFEGDVDGDGQIDSIRYRQTSTSTESTRCPCLERSQVTKVTGDPLAGQGTAYHVLVENAASSGLTFSAYDSNGAVVTIPSGGLTITSNPSTLASIRTIGVAISVLGKYPDQQTRQFPAGTVSALARLKN